MCNITIRTRVNISKEIHLPYTVHIFPYFVRIRRLQLFELSAPLDFEEHLFALC